MTNQSMGGDSDLNRSLIEKKGTKAILLNHSLKKRDSLYERDSGLNQVLCKLARQKDIEFIIDLNELNVSDLKQRSEILGRITQNIELTSKFKNRLKIISIKNSDSNGMRALLLTIGMPTNRINPVLHH